MQFLIVSTILKNPTLSSGTRRINACVIGIYSQEILLWLLDTNYCTHAILPWESYFGYVLNISKLQLAQTVLGNGFLSQSLLTPILYDTIDQVKMRRKHSEPPVFFSLRCFQSTMQRLVSLHKVIELSHLKTAETKQYRSAPGSMVTRQEHNSFVN